MICSSIIDLVGKADYYINGRRVGNIIYDINGNPIRTDFSSSGAPDLIGGVGKYTLAGGKLVLKLASQAQMSEKGVSILGKLRAGSRLASQYGGKASDWVKMSSTSYSNAFRTIETHWYQNLRTNARVEFKTKLIR